MSEEKKQDEIKEEEVQEEAKQESCEETKPETPSEEAEVKEESEEPVEEEKDPAAEIAELNEQIAKLKNAYAKAYADTENTRKRLENDFSQRSKYLIKDFALELLPVLDNFERALSQEAGDESYRQGVEMIYRQLKAALEKQGVTEIEALNQPFDPNWHQAVMSEEIDGVEPNTVVMVLQKGYKLKDRLLRAAMVKVSA